MIDTQRLALLPRPAARSIALVLLTLATSATGRPSAERHVALLEPVAVTPVAQLPAMLAFKIESLAQIDPDHPVGPDSDLQTLSLFGREDLIAGSSPSYTPTHCAPLAAATPALAEIERRARDTRIVIINESHERSEHRGFSAQVARALRPLGYDVLALETLSNPPAEVPARYLPSYRVHPERGYFADDDGHYLSEAGYGRFGRAAKALGYTLLAYEDEPPPALPLPRPSRSRRVRRHRHPRLRRSSQRTRARACSSMSAIRTRAKCRRRKARAGWRHD